MFFVFCRFNFKEKVQQLSLSDVYKTFSEDHPNVLDLIDLVLPLPASSSENERGFNNMKLIKTITRNRLSSAALTSVMQVQVALRTTIDNLQSVNEWLRQKLRDAQCS